MILFSALRIKPFSNTIFPHFCEMFAYTLRLCQLCGNVSDAEESSDIVDHFGRNVIGNLREKSRNISPTMSLFKNRVYSTNLSLFNFLKKCPNIEILLHVICHFDC